MVVICSENLRKKNWKKKMRKSGPRKKPPAAPNWFMVQLIPKKFNDMEKIKFQVSVNWCKKNKHQ